MKVKNTTTTTQQLAQKSSVNRNLMTATRFVGLNSDFLKFSVHHDGSIVQFRIRHDR